MDAATIAGWDTHHDWMIRDLEMDPGIPLMLHQCRRCGRNFVTEPGLAINTPFMWMQWVSADCLRK
jgi:hypothetical protein